MTAASIASEIAAALSEAATATGNGPFYVTMHIKRADDKTVFPPVIGGWVQTQVLALTDTKRLRDASGNLLTATRTTLTIEDKAGVIPKNGDRVQIDAVMFTIREVIPTGPGGVALMYDLDVERS